VNGEDGASHTDIIARVGRLEGARIERDKALDDRMDQRDEAVDTRLDRMESKIDKLVSVTDMGKGAWWMVVKLGAIAAGLAAAGTWIWDRLPDGLKKSLIG
jgi:hypothetical protein